MDLINKTSSIIDEGEINEYILINVMKYNKKNLHTYEDIYK